MCRDSWRVRCIKFEGDGLQAVRKCWHSAGFSPEGLRLGLARALSLDWSLKYIIRSSYLPWISFCPANR